MTMAELTPKQENFCLSYIEAGNASEAYRNSYNTAKMNDATINRAAKELMDNPKIATRITELRKPAVEAAQVTLEQHLNDLKKLRDDAWSSEKWQAAIQAEIARGKVSGLYVDKIEHSGKLEVESLTDDDIDRKIAEANSALGLTHGKAAITATATRKIKKNK